MSVPVRLLHEVCEITMGQAPDGSSYNDEGKGLPLIAGAGDFGTDYPAAKKFTTVPTKTSLPNDIVMSIRATIGTKVLSDGVYCLGRGVAGLRPKHNLELRYLWHWLGSAERTLAGKGRGATFLQVNSIDIAELEIRLPPLPEQQRIAEILDKADALRRQRKRAIELLDSLMQSIFLEMFGDLELNERGWATLSFDRVVSIDALLVDPRRPEFTGLLHYGPDRIEKDTGRLLPAKTAGNDGLISKKFLCDETHILYSKIRPYLNKVALCERLCLCSADIYPVSVNSKMADRIFIWYLLRSSTFRKYADTCSNRANIPKINREQFLSFQAPVPPLEIQRQFAAVRQQVSRSFEPVLFSQSGFNSLFSSLQHRAFSGQL